MYRPHNFRVPVHFLIFRLRGGSVAGRCVEVAGGSTSLANIPLIEVGHLRGQSAGTTPGWVQHWGQGGTHRSPHCWITKGSWRRWGRLAVNLHVLPQRARVSVRFVAASDLAVIGFVTGVDMRMFLSITAIGKLPITAIKFTFERLFSCNETQERLTVAFHLSLERNLGAELGGLHFPILPMTNTQPCS